MTEKLQQARETEQSISKNIPKEQRPAFHMTPITGWTNDPNGFSAYKGEYHLFYQSNPYDIHWGSLHWGHYKTKDFIRWEYVPCALAPDMPYDRDGCFSGSGLEWNGKHYLMYTSNREEKETDGTIKIRQTQSIAVGDGRDYEKLPSNPVITADKLPAGSSFVDFRDPKIWQEGDDLYAVIGNRSDDGSGQIVLFTSKDMKNWEFVTVLDRCENRYGKMWECPDFFELDGKQLLMVSPQEMTAEGLTFHNGNGNICLIGSYDRITHTFIREKAVPVDYGMDFYASQTTETLDGRRVMIAWMQNWENYLTPPEYQWSGLMTIPRELHIQDGKLYQKPVHELKNYYGLTYFIDSIKAPKLTELSRVTGRIFDMTVEFDTAECRELELRLASDGRFHTDLLYDGRKGLLTADRTYSGYPRDLLAIRSMEMPEQNGTVKLRVLMDKYSIEVFVNDGEKAMTYLTYGPLSADRIFFRSDGCFSVTFHELREPPEEIFRKMSQESVV